VPRHWCAPVGRAVGGCGGAFWAVGVLSDKQGELFAGAGEETARNNGNLGLGDGMIGGFRRYLPLWSTEEGLC